MIVLLTHSWRHWRMSVWQPSVPQVLTGQSTWWHFCFDTPFKLQPTAPTITTTTTATTLLSIVPSGTYFSEIQIKLQMFSFKMLFAKRLPFCFILNVLHCNDEHHGVSNLWQFGCLFNSLFWLTWGQLNALPYWPSAKGIHQWPADSLHKGPVMWKGFPCQEAVMSCMLFGCE